MPDRFHERGAAAVEMAFVTMFLLILVTGIIDVGRGIYHSISVQEAAQEGAHFGAFEGPISEDDIRQRVIASTSSPVLLPGKIEVDCSVISRSLQNGARVTVTVTHDLDLVTPIVGQWLGGKLTLEKTAEAERYFEDCPSI